MATGDLHQMIIIQRHKEKCELAPKRKKLMGKGLKHILQVHRIPYLQLGIEIKLMFASHVEIFGQFQVHLHGHIHPGLGQKLA